MCFRSLLAVALMACLSLVGCAGDAEATCVAGGNGAFSFFQPQQRVVVQQFAVPVRQHVVQQQVVQRVVRQKFVQQPVVVRQQKFIAVNQHHQPTQFQFRQQRGLGNGLVGRILFGP